MIIYCYDNDPHMQWKHLCYIGNGNGSE